MIISLMVAISKNNVIGKDNKLLWQLSDDLKNFKKVTLNKPILMGRKTYDSIGRPLPKRDNIVLTKNQNLSIDGAFVYTSPAAALEAFKEHDELVIIGGGHLYSQFINKVDKMYITHVDCEIDGDAFFPDVDLSKFKLTHSFTHPSDEKNEYSWTFCEYERL